MEKLYMERFYKEDMEKEDMEFEAFMMKMAEAYENHKRLPIPTSVITKTMRAYAEAKRLFDWSEVTIHDDPLGLGALSISINGFDIVARGEEGKAAFNRIIREAACFEIYATGPESICMNVTFQR